MSFAIVASLMGAAQAQDFVVCPSRSHDVVGQIYLFDGPPEELVYLAPDDSSGASNYYSIGSIYDSGRFVTVRCKYKGGAIVDVQLKSRAKSCTFQDEKEGYGNLRCR